MPTRKNANDRDGGVRYAIEKCSLGLVLIAATQHGICAVWFGDNRQELERQLKHDFPAASTDGTDKEFDGWVSEVIARIEHPGAETDLPLDMTGTPFQKRVWAALRKIPSGKTASYSQIAARINHPTAQRAVARACATNPVGVIVPCHRVIALDGKISGYAGGVERKQALLKREAENAGVRHEPSLV